MMMGLKSVDEGEGMINLVKAISIQAEMYKNMGLWPLALALCEDAVDLTVMLLGYQQVQSQNGLRLVVACLLKMRCIPLLGSTLRHFVVESRRKLLAPTISNRPSIGWRLISF